MGDIKTYKDLIAWQKSIQLVTDIYALTRTFPENEKFGLATQLNRAAVSVPSNIAEGWGRETSKNFVQFLRNSRGSVMEIQTQLIIAKNLGYIHSDKYELLAEKSEEVGKIIQSLIKGISKKIKITESV